jgi:general nucleoside transport system permease protein
MIFGKYNPLGAALACLIFGLGYALSLPLQDLSTNPNLYYLLQTLPYVLVLISLVGIVGRTTPPAADGIPYEPGTE